MSLDDWQGDWRPIVNNDTNNTKKEGEETDKCVNKYPNATFMKFVIHTSRDKYPDSATNAAKLVIDINLPFKDVMNEIYCWFEKNHPSIEFEQPDKLIRHAITFETEGAFYFKDGSEFVLPEIILQQPTPKVIARRKRAMKKLNRRKRAMMKKLNKK